MCRMCEGASWEELVELARTRIAVYGYTLQAVADDAHAPWVYTTGLLDSAHHPELIVAGVPVDTSARVLASLAESVLEGVRLEVGDTVCVQGGTATVGSVHEIQYRLDTFNVWRELRRAGVLRAPRLTAVQILLEPTSPESRSPHPQPRLVDPTARVGVPSRVARRRSRHQRSRRR